MLRTERERSLYALTEDARRLQQAFFASPHGRRHGERSVNVDSFRALLQHGIVIPISKALNS